MTTTINASTVSGLIQTADTSGILQLQTANLPAVTINAAQNTTVNNSLTVNTNLTVTGSTTLNSSVIRSGTAVASTSGTNIDFTGIPSWVKRITVMFNGVSTSGTSQKLIQIGSGTFTTTGYVSSSCFVSIPTANSTAGTSSTAGYIMYHNNSLDSINGALTIYNITGNIWVSNHATGSVAGNSGSVFGGGTLTSVLSGALDRVRITTVTGTDTFDAGSINILFE